MDFSSIMWKHCFFFYLASILVSVRKEFEEKFNLTLSLVSIPLQLDYWTSCWILLSFSFSMWKMRSVAYLPPGCRKDSRQFLQWTQNSAGSVASKCHWWQWPCYQMLIAVTISTPWNFVLTRSILRLVSLMVLGYPWILMETTLPTCQIICQ